MANCAWLAPNPRNAPQTGLFVRAAIDSTSIVGQVVRAAGVAGHALEHLHPDAGVGAAVADGADLQTAVSVPSASHPAQYSMSDRVALGVDAEALLARQRALHRAPQQPGGQRGMRLVAHVLLAAEGAAVGDELDRPPARW